MTTGECRIVIVGGYGVFGGRLALLLSRNSSLTLVIAGRSIDKARRFIAGLPLSTARLEAARLDRDHDPEAALAALAPDVVVDATGPFQIYGRDPYRLVRATLAANASYLDLADSPDFVAGIEQFNEEAVRRGVYLLSGVSSFPVLTAAAVRALCDGMETIDCVRGGIAPSPYAGVGLNVIRAVIGYAGQPIQLIRDGQVRTAHAFTESLRYTIAPPGLLPLRNTRFSLVDVPDLLLVPRADRRIATLWMGAGPVPEILHRALTALAWLVRLRLLPSLSPLASLCYWAINRLRWGEHRGGMFVEVAGRGAEGQMLARSWHLLAEGDDGPLIPSMAIAIIVLKALAGTPPQPGARPATDALELGDYDEMFAARTISTGYRDDSGVSSWPLYRRLLGDAWMALPPRIRELHALDGQMTARGIARVENGRSLLSRIIRNLVRFPSHGSAIPITVSFRATDGVERWTRRFGNEQFTSLQYAGAGRNDRLLVERFGPVAAAMALVLDGGRLRLVVRRWSLFSLPLPMRLFPKVDAYEYEQDGRFHFHVAVHHRLAGQIVLYRGWLQLDEAEPIQGRKKLVESRSIAP